MLTLSTCSNVCILTDYPFALDMTVPAGDGFSYDYTRALGTLPRPDGLTSRLTSTYGGGKLTVTAVREAGWQQPSLFIDSVENVDFGKPIFSLTGDTLVAQIPVTDSWGEAAPDLSGKRLSLALPTAVWRRRARRSLAKVSAQAPALWWVLLMALAGGLILNVMPCVLPVLAIKLGSLVQTGTRERATVRRQFLASVCGIVVSFLALALMMTLLRLGNQALGWGIQFQNPWFIGAMALVMVLFSASLLGLFEIRLSSGASTFLATRGGKGLMGHFWQGAFATLLATPCSAVSRYRRLGRAGRAAAAAVGYFLRHGGRDESAVAAGCRLARPRPASAAPWTLDERPARDTRIDDAGIGRMAARPADGAYRSDAGYRPDGTSGPRASAGDALALSLAHDAESRRADVSCRRGRRFSVTA